MIAPPSPTPRKPPSDFDGVQAWMIFEVRHIGDRRQQIVLVGHRERIAARVVAGLLQQHRADRLRETAGNLSFDDGGIDDRCRSPRTTASA